MCRKEDRTAVEGNRSRYDSTDDEVIITNVINNNETGSNNVRSDGPTRRIPARTDSHIRAILDGSTRRIPARTITNENNKRQNSTTNLRNSVQDEMQNDPNQVQIQNDQPLPQNDRYYHQNKYDSTNDINDPTRGRGKGNICFYYYKNGIDTSWCAGVLDQTKRTTKACRFVNDARWVRARTQSCIQEMVRTTIYTQEIQIHRDLLIDKKHICKHNIYWSYQRNNGNSW